MEYILLTNSNNIAELLVQIRKVDKLLSTKGNVCKVKFSEFANEGSRIFS